MITEADVVRSFELDDVDCAGLDRVEREYVALLSSASTPMSVSALAHTLGMPMRMIQTVVEPVLLREKLIQKVEGGLRALTDKGRRHANAEPS